MEKEDQERLSRCLEALEEETTVLRSVYDSLVRVEEVDDGSKYIYLVIPIVLPCSTSTELSYSFAADAATAFSTVTPLQISHLPPITVKLLLSPFYPVYEPPTIMVIKADLGFESHQWLNKRHLTELEGRILTMWAEDKEMTGEGSGVIWRWWEWIGSGEFLSDLGVLEGDTLRLRPAVNTLMSTFYNALKTYDSSQTQSNFARTAFSCGICLEDRKGKSCIQMPGCGCVFCVPCLSSGWTLAITEGSLENVFCPSVACTKERALKEEKTENEHKVITAELVESVVGKTLRERWEWVKENRIMETDPTYTICPRPACQRPVPPPAAVVVDVKPVETSTKRVIRLSDISTTQSNSTSTATDSSSDITIKPILPDDRWDRYRRCPSCQYSFCLYCSATWHGPHAPCAFTTASVIVEEYLSYPEGSPERLKMEIRRGKRNIEKMIAKWQEDEENKKWMEEKTMPCSGCGVRVERSYGCNHMTCGRCGSHFCYRCGRSISPQDPYAHYRKPGTECFERLFDPEELLRIQREDVWV